MIPKQLGFTLMEVMTATAVIGTLAAIALPRYADAQAATRATQVRTELVQTLMTASSSAANLGAHVVLCPSAGDACIASDDWSYGILAFIDSNNNRLYDPAETIIANSPPAPPRTHVRSTVGRKRIVFQPNGGAAGSNVTFTVCDERGPSKAVSVILANEGRWRTAPPTAAAASFTCRS